MAIERNFNYREDYLACPECDLLHSAPEIREGEQGHCIRCGALLFVRHHNSLERALAFSLTGVSFFVLGNMFPLLTFEMDGQTESNRLIDGAIAFWQAGYWELGLIVFIFSVATPLAVLLVLVTLLLPLRLGRAPLFPKFQIRLFAMLKPWAMSEIFILGILVAFVKLQDFADVGVGFSLFAIVLMVIATVMAYLTLDVRALWARLEELAA